MLTEIYPKGIEESTEEYLLYLEQSLRMLELLQDLEITTKELEKKLRELMEDLKTRLNSKGWRYPQGERIICQGYQVMNTLLEIKDVEEQLLELLEGKLLFPQGTMKRRLLQYFVCDIGIRLLYNTKLRFKLHQSMIGLLENQEKGVKV